MTDAVIVGACRTPIADAYRGSLANVSIHESGQHVVTEALERAGIAGDRCRRPRARRGAPRRRRHRPLHAPSSSVPTDVPAWRCKRQCATGMTAVDGRRAEIIAGMNRVVVAGGAGAMTQSPVQLHEVAVPVGGHGAVALARHTPTGPTRRT